MGWQPKYSVPLAAGALLLIAGVRDVLRGAPRTPGTIFDLGLGVLLVVSYILLVRRDVARTKAQESRMVRSLRRDRG